MSSYIRHDCWHLFAPGSFVCCLMWSVAVLLAMAASRWTVDCVCMCVYWEKSHFGYDCSVVDIFYALFLCFYKTCCFGFWCCICHIHTYEALSFSGFFYIFTTECIFLINFSQHSYRHSRLDLLEAYNFWNNPSWSLVLYVNCSELRDWSV